MDIKIPEISYKPGDFRKAFDSNPDRTTPNDAKEIDVYSHDLTGLSKEERFEYLERLTLSK